MSAPIGVRRWRAAVSLLAALALPPSPLAAQVPEYALKAEFLERFTRFVEWPEGSTGADAATPFVIGVYRTNPFGNELTRVAAGRRVKGKPIEVRLVSSPAEAEQCALLFIPASEGKAEQCALLFIPASEGRSLAAILARTAEKPVLTVSEIEGAAEKGVVVNFYTSEDNLRFEINDAAVRKSRLDVSSRLLKLARVLNLEPRR